MARITTCTFVTLTYAPLLEQVPLSRIEKLSSKKLSSVYGSICMVDATLAPVRAPDSGGARSIASPHCACLRYNLTHSDSKDGFTLRHTTSRSAA
jgi:hypothetical protein